jgi:MFS family permease
LTASTLVGWDLLAARLRAARHVGSGTNVWSPLKSRHFVLFLVCTLFGSLGSRVNELASVWLMTDLTRSPFMISLVTTALSLPAFLLALPAGVLGDMFDRRRLMLIAESLFVVNLSVLAMLTLWGLTTPVILLTSAALTGFFATIVVTTNDAILPQIVERRDFAAAIALTGARYQLSQTIGPILGGLMISTSSIGHAFIVCAIAPFAMMLFLWSWQTPSGVTPLRPEPVKAALRAGLHYVRYAPQLDAVLVRVVAFIAAGSAMWALLPVYVRHHLNMGPMEYGLLFGLFGIGGIVGSTAAYRVNRASEETVLTASTLAFALSLFLLTQTSSIEGLGSALFFSGAAWSAAMLSFKTSIQMAAPDWVRGRISSIYILTLHGAAAVGSAMWGLIANYYDSPHTLRYAALAMVATLALTTRYRLVSVSAITEDHAVPKIDPLELPAATVREGVPFMITLDYCVDPNRCGEFEQLMHQIGWIRRRTGATFWGLFSDPDDPGKYCEYFIVESIHDAMWMHDRLTDPERETVTLAHSFHTVGLRPIAHHHKMIC